MCFLNFYYAKAHSAGPISLVTFVQAAKGDVIVYYNQIFDALCKLSADPDVAVHRAALILDQGLKVSAGLFFLNQKLHSCQRNSNVFGLIKELKLYELHSFILLIDEQDIVCTSDQFR